MGKQDDITITVDDHDQVLAQKPYKDVARTERRRLSIIMLHNDAGEVLIAQRSERKTILPLFWGTTAAGTVEAHETYEQNAYKELSEELGIEEVDLTFVGNFYSDKPDGARHFLGIFQGLYNGELNSLKLQDEEVADAKWISIDELKAWMAGDQKVISDMHMILSVLGFEMGEPLVEYAHITDDNDRLLCYKPRALIGPEDIMRTTSIWIEDGKGNVLTQQRGKNVGFKPGLWDGAGGGAVNSTETPEENAYKELAEEMGASGIQLDFVQTTFLPPNENGVGYHVYWYKGICDWPIEKFIPQPEEVDQIRWGPKQQLLSDAKKHPEKYLSSAQQWRSLFI